MGLRTNTEAQAAVAAFIETVRPHLVLLTVGAPQSEIVAQLVKARGQAKGVAICVGASLEFLTGEKRRAPRFVQAMGMEWAFRLLSEPRRLWRRYLVEGPAILAIWLRWRQRRNTR
jgi:exopolysaccharide biosynthesis WecB/TagA/CpsF family protein